MLKLNVYLALLLVLLAGIIASRGHNLPAAGPLPDLSPYPWFYLRDGRPLAHGEEPVELLLTGDISFGRETANGYRPAPGDSLAAVASWVRPAGLALGNLESVLVAAEMPPAVPHDAYLLRGRPSDALTLSAAGFDLLSVGNNHAWDYGAAGLATSNAHLRQFGLAAVGTEPVFREVNGVRIAFLAFNQIPSAAPAAPEPSSTAAIVAAVTAAGRQAGVVVVSLHWGYEYDLQPDPAQERLARALRAAGADVIAGHHPHVVQPVSILDGGLVAYSLGNFLFDQGEGETGRGLALRVLLDRQGVRAVQALPVRAGTRPALFSPAEAATFLARITPPPRRIGFAGSGEEFTLTTVPQEPVAGRFSGGQADLTGDGRPEQVRLEGTRVHIYGSSRLLWESPADWEVVDVALGDPNDDGRQELVLAVWKEDPAGYRRSHPYLVGYRGGEYTLIWGGRAVMDPIHELALGDVDGDGRQELLVLLQRASLDDHAVAVWRWHGWGFSLLWQSPPGRYRDLVFLPGADGAPPAFSVALAGE